MTQKSDDDGFESFLKFQQWSVTNPPPKRGRAQYGEYVRKEDLLSHIVPKLNELGFAYLEGGEYLDGQWINRVRFLHRSGWSHTSILPLMNTRETDQSLGSSCTYDGRYNGSMMACSIGEEDDDGNSNEVIKSDFDKFNAGPIGVRQITKTEVKKP